MTSPGCSGRLSFSTSQGWTVKSCAGSKPIRSAEIVMAADARMLDPHDLLGGDAAQARQPRLGERIGIEHQLGRLDDQQRGGDVGERPLGHHHHVGAEAGEAHRHAAVDALHQHGAGEDDAAAQGHRRDQQEAARLAAPEVLKGEAEEQPAHQSVQDRVFFMCSSLVGMMTQSWWPPLLGRMPISVSVEVSMTEMPLCWRWKPENGVIRYLPS